MRNSLLLHLFSTFTLFLSSPLAAETRTSTIIGLVQDESGAVVRAAEIRARHIATGAERTTETGPDGRYRIPSLEVGEYVVSASKAGFRNSQHRGVPLELQRDAVVDHVLSLGPVSDSIVVAARPRHVESHGSTLSDLINTDAIQRLPLNGRDYIQLATLLAGAPIARTRGRNVNMGFGLQLSIAGSRPFQNSFRDTVSIQVVGVSIAR